MFLQVAANVLGVAAVAAYFRFLYPLPTSEEIGDVDLNVVVFGIYVAVMGMLALPVNAVLLRRAVIWAREGTPPTVRQRRLLFSLPLAETLSALLSWVGAAVLFGLFNRGSERIAIGIALAGVVTCALLYLLLEGYFRPLYALALEDAELPEDRRDVLPRLMLALGARQRGAAHRDRDDHRDRPRSDCSRTDSRGSPESASSREPR